MFPNLSISILVLLCCQGTIAGPVNNLHLQNASETAIPLAQNTTISTKLYDSPDSTVSAASCFFTLLALASICMSQPNGRIHKDSDKTSRYLRISPMFCTLEIILLADQYAKLLLRELNPVEAAQCLAVYRYSDNDDFPLTPFGVPHVPARVQTFHRVLDGIGNNVRLQRLLAIPTMLQFAKLWGMHGNPFESAAGVAYVLSWLLNEILIWMASWDRNADAETADAQRLADTAHDLRWCGFGVQGLWEISSVPQAIQAFLVPMWGLIKYYQLPLNFPIILRTMEASFETYRVWVEDKESGEPLMKATAIFGLVVLKYCVYVSAIGFLIALLYWSIRAVVVPGGGRQIVSRASVILVYFFWVKIAVVAVFVIVILLIAGWNIVIDLWCGLVFMLCVFAWFCVYVAAPAVGVFLFFALPQMLSRSQAQGWDRVMSYRTHALHTLLVAGIYYGEYYNPEGTARSAWIEYLG